MNKIAIVVLLLFSLTSNAQVVKTDNQLQRLHRLYLLINLK